jgi:hypothetical protein
LVELITTQEKVRGFLSNLEKIKSEGTISEEHYTATRLEYEQNLNSVAAEIVRAKSAIQKQLVPVQQEMAAQKLELGKLETRYRVGELTLEKYQIAGSEFRTKIEQLELRSNELGKLLAAESLQDISFLMEKSLTEAVPPPSSINEEKPESAKPKKETKFPTKLVAILGGAAVLIVVIVVVVLNLMGGGGGTGLVTEVKVPINLKNAANIASLHLELTYDSKTLNAVSLTGGNSLGNAIYEYDLKSPGEILFGMVSSQGIKTDGSLVVITFKLSTTAGSVTSMNLKNVIAYDGNTFTEVSSSTTAGSLNIRSGDVLPPTITFRTK